MNLSFRDCHSNQGVSGETESNESAMRSRAKPGQIIKLVSGSSTPSPTPPFLPHTSPSPFPFPWFSFGQFLSRCLLCPSNLPPAGSLG